LNLLKAATNVAPPETFHRHGLDIPVGLSMGPWRRRQCEKFIRLSRCSNAKQFKFLKSFYDDFRNVILLRQLSGVENGKFIFKIDPLGLISREPISFAQFRRLNEE
jgi:hypothetical protein